MSRTEHVLQAFVALCRKHAMRIAGLGLRAAMVNLHLVTALAKAAIKAQLADPAHSQSAAEQAAPASI